MIIYENMQSLFSLEEVDVALDDRELIIDLQYL